MGKVSKGIVWSAFDKFSNQAIGLLISIILARLISPSSYGLIVMISVFVSITTIFIDAGFTNALIQKKDRTDEDYSTVFVFNIAISIFFYLVLFFCAPLIAKFYNEPQLTTLTRVITLNLIIGSFGACQRTRLTINLDFKTQAKAGLISVVVSGIIGIICAYAGLEVWALVIQSLLSTVITNSALIYMSKWMPRFRFYKESFKRLFSFGSKLMLGDILTSIYLNIYNLFIGKKYNSAELAFYNKAFSISQLPSTNIEGVIQRVAYPVLCNLQDDKENLIKSYFKYLHFSNFIIVPLMTIMAVLAKPLIYVLLTEKWLPTVPFLQIFCVNFMFYSWINQSGSLVNAIGKSGVMLNASIFKRIFSFLVLLATLPFGITVICWGIAGCSVMEAIVGMYCDKRELGITFMSQFKSQYDIYLICLIMGAILYLFCMVVDNPYIQLFAGGVLGIIIYIAQLFVFKIEEKQLVIKYFNKIFNRK